MATKVIYPVYLYKSTGEVAVCDNEVQVNLNKAKGFILVSRPSLVVFPTVLYNSKGETQVAANESDLNRWPGFGSGFVAPPPAAPSMTVGGAQGISSEVLRAIFGEIGELRNRVDTMEQILEAQTKAQKQPDSKRQSVKE